MSHERQKHGFIFEETIAQKYGISLIKNNMKFPRKSY